MARGKKSNTTKPVEEPEDSSPEASDAEEVENEVDDDESNEASDQDDENEDADSDEESESDDEEDVTALFKGVNVPKGGGSDEGSDDDSDDGDKPAQSKNVKNSEQCTFDLRNMIAVNSHQIKASSLYSSKKQSDAEQNITIPLDNGHGLDLDEDFLLDRASSSCTQLIHALWQLPSETSDAGPLVSLPGYDEIKIPRALVSTIPRSCDTYFFYPRLAHCFFFAIFYSRHHLQNKRRNGKSLQSKKESRSTRKKDHGKSGMKLPEHGCFGMDSKKQTAKRTNGQLWKWVQLITLTMIRGRK
jgi:hypothetical protein